MRGAVGWVLRRYPRVREATLATHRAAEVAARRWRGPQILRRRFAEVCGYELDEANPTTFTEHVYCRMIDTHRHCDPRMRALADKLGTRDYVARTVGADHVPRLYWTGRDPARIPFDDLPGRFVIKTNHACGHVIRVDGDVDRDGTIATVRAWMARDYYWASREHHYYGIAPRVIVEERLDDGYPDGPLDYRWYCFHGRPALVMVGDHGHVLQRFYDPDWRRVDTRYRPDRGDYEIRRPDGLARMLSVAARLSHGFDFVRVDMFDVPGRVLVSELTFTPNAGYRPFDQASVELELGRLWAGTAVEPSLPLV